MKLDDLIQSARGDEPTPEQLKKLDGKLAHLMPPIGGGNGPSGSGGGHGAAGAGGAATVKWIAAGVVAVGSGVAIQQAVSHRDGAPPPPISAPAPTPAPIAEVTPDAAPEPVPAPAPAAAVHRAPEPSLADEAALLDRARTALQRGDARAALATCDAHAKNFTHGALREERERIAIEALLALGRHGDAEARAQRFDRAFPNSVQSERIHALLRDR